MTFDLVMGNPPYQNKDQRSSLYPAFIKFGIDIADTVCMITRDNWLTGMTFEDIRNCMGGVEYIYHYPIVGEVFNDLGVAVAYFLWSKDYNEETNYTRIEHDNEVSNRTVDINRIIVSDTAASISNKVTCKESWGDIYNSRSYPFMDQRKRFKLSTDLNKNENFNVAIKVNKGQTVYTNIENFNNTDEVKKYNILCGVNINEAPADNPGNVLTNIIINKPMEVTSETWSLIASFDNSVEAYNCKKYVMTKFFRFLANLTVNVKATVTKNTFKYIPLQNFTDSSDIDWSQSIQNIDEQLYKKYKLSDEEIVYIEKTIKQMK